MTPLARRIVSAAALLALVGVARSTAAQVVTQAAGAAQAIQAEGLPEEVALVLLGSILAATATLARRAQARRDR